MSAKKIKMEEEKKVEDVDLVMARADEPKEKAVVTIRKLTFAYDKDSGKKNIDGLDCVI